MWPVCVAPSLPEPFPMGAGTKELPPESLPSLLSALEKGANGEMGNAFLGKHGWVHRWDVGHASNQPPPISRISFAAPSSLNQDPAVPTRRDQRRQEVAKPLIVILVGRLPAPPTMVAQSRPTGSGKKRDILCPATA